jgi:adenine-specific DNA-methyltransferase
MAEKLEMASSNIISENIEYIATKFPNALKEVMENGKLVKKIDFDVLKQELSTLVMDDKQERYQMTWPDKKKSILLANSRINATLRPVKEKSVDFDNTQNLYIEGDNLDVLKLLRETYLGKIKMIYIDPPYNTGNDFVYEDDFSQSSEEYLARSGQFDDQGNRLFQNNDSNGRFHTDWLNMMYPRLKIAKDLLSDDGVIFISIDENELDNLLKMCSEIFGEKNFIGQWNWFKSATPPNLSFKIKKNIEYIICYEKNRDDIRYTGRQKISASNDPFTKPQNTYKTLFFPKSSITTNLENGVYKKGLYGTEKFPNDLLDDLIIEDGKNSNEVRFNNRFIWTQETLNDNLSKGLYVYLSKQLVLSYKKREYSPESPPNLIDHKVDVDTTEQAGSYLTTLFGRKVFDYPKPVSLIKYLINFKDKKDSLIMDFFSGSGTTAESIIRLNAEDGGNRKFIMVQLPESIDKKSEAFNAGYKNICEIGQERIRRAGKIIKDEAGDLGQNLDIGFRVLKLDSSNMNEVYYNPNRLNQDMLDQLVGNIKEDRTPLDLLFQVMLELGIELSAKIQEKELFGKKYFVVNESDLVACFDDGINDEFVKEIAKIHSIYAVFKDSAFTNDSSNINCEQIFKSISPSTTIKVV